MSKELIESYLSYKTPNINWAKRMALRSQAYYDLNPYPIFGFQEWKIEERGPLPKCVPFCSNIVRRSAKWLFGNPPRISSSNPKGSDAVLRAFENLYPKLTKAAVTSLLEGSVSLRFSYNFDRKTCHFSFLSTLDNVRYITDPHDQDRVILVFVQYPYFDSASNKWLFYREAWTEEVFATFKPVEASFNPVNFGGDRFYGNVAFVISPETSILQTPDSFEGWQLDKVVTNPLGFIPVIQIRNEEGNTFFGEGILWRVTHIIDRINLAYHLMDRSNQFDSDPTTIFIDADLDTTDASTIAPGGVHSLNTRETADSGNRQAKVTLLEPAGRLRSHMAEYVHDLRQQVSDLTGTVEISTKEVSNKGNFTQSVLNQLYAPIIEATNSRRAVWEKHIETFLGKCAQAVEPFYKSGWSENDRFNLTWPDYFILPEQEKGLKLNRLILQESKGLITKSRVIEQVASMDNIEDVEVFIKELEDYTPSLDAQDSSLEPAPYSINMAKPKSKEDTILS